MVRHEGWDVRRTRKLGNNYIDYEIIIILLQSAMIMTIWFYRWQQRRRAWRCTEEVTWKINNSLITWREFTDCIEVLTAVFHRRFTSNGQPADRIFKLPLPYPVAMEMRRGRSDTRGRPRCCLLDEKRSWHGQSSFFSLGWINHRRWEQIKRPTKYNQGQRASFNARSTFSSPVTNQCKTPGDCVKDLHKVTAPAGSMNPCIDLLLLPIFQRDRVTCWYACQRNHT